MKRLLLLLFSISLTFPLFALYWNDPSTGITWTYTVSSQGKVTLGRGNSMDGYTAISKKTKGDLIVPAYINGWPVVELSWYAFYGCTELTSITLPNTVTEIGVGAFKLCSSLTSVNIQNGVKTIASDTFSGCESLKMIKLPDTITTLDSKAFFESGLVHLDIPDGVKEIPKDCFSGAKALQSITFPATLTKIDGSAFYGCRALSYLTIPNGVTEISGYLYATGAQTIILPESLTTWSGTASAKNASVFAYCPPPNDLTQLKYCSNLFYSEKYKTEWEDCLSKMSDRPTAWGLMSDHLKSVVKAIVVPAMAGSWVFENNEVAEGTPVTVNAMANEGYLFMGWSSTENNVSSSALSLTFALPRQPIMLVATFLPKTSIEGMIDQRLDTRIDGESLLTKEQAEAKTEATIEEKKEAGELFDQAGVDAKIEATITEKVDNKELVTRESIQEMSLGSPIIEVEDAQAKVGISLKRASTLDGEWEEVALDAGAAEVDNGTVKVSVPAEDNAAFYKFVVPDGLQTPVQKETP